MPNLCKRGHPSSVSRVGRTSSGACKECAALLAPKYRERYRAQKRQRNARRTQAERTLEAERKRQRMRRDPEYAPSR